MLNTTCLQTVIEVNTLSIIDVILYLVLTSTMFSSAHSTSLSIHIMKDTLQYVLIQPCTFLARYTDMH